MIGFVAMIAGAALAINQSAQVFATQQQASIAAHEAAIGHQYVYQHTGSLFAAGLGAAIFIWGLIEFYRS